ncbi:MAG: phosphohistidine phosphatase SixA [Chthoniobacter sp.]|nr:phosphohistidine phosphatase SixA [Chthoniobacter sp.]
MLIYLLRHADADTPAARDVERALSEKGRAQARKVGAFCEAQEIDPALLLSSPVRRARETAEIVAEKMRAEVVLTPWLACGMSPHTALEELRALRGETSVMLVGHEPDLGLLAAHLLGLATPTALHVRKGSLMSIDLGFIRAGAGCLQFALPSRLM